MKIITSKKQNELAKLKFQLEFAKICYESKTDYDKEDAITKLLAGIDKIYAIIGI